MRDWRWRLKFISSLLFSIFFIFIIYYFLVLWWKYDPSWLDLIIMMIVKSWSIPDLMIIWNRTIGIRKKTNVGALAITDRGRRWSHMTATWRYLESRFCWLWFRMHRHVAVSRIFDHTNFTKIMDLWPLFKNDFFSFLIVFYIWNSVSKYSLYPQSV